MKQIKKEFWEKFEGRVRIKYNRTSVGDYTEHTHALTFSILFVYKNMSILLKYGLSTIIDDADTYFKDMSPKDKNKIIKKCWKACCKQAVDDLFKGKDTFTLYNADCGSLTGSRMLLEESQPKLLIKTALKEFFGKSGSKVKAGVDTKKLYKDLTEAREYHSIDVKGFSLECLSTPPTKTPKEERAIQDKHSSKICIEILEKTRWDHSDEWNDCLNKVIDGIKDVNRKEKKPKYGIGVKELTERTNLFMLKSKQEEIDKLNKKIKRLEEVMSELAQFAKKKQDFLDKANKGKKELTVEDRIRMGNEISATKREKQLEDRIEAMRITQLGHGRNIGKLNSTVKFLKNKLTNAN